MAMQIRDIRNPAIRAVRSDTTAMFVHRAPTYTPRFVGSAVLAMVSIYIAVTTLFQWGSVQLADVRYGATRTFHADAVVGINDNPDQPSHFVAMNVNSRIVIMHIPGGDSSQTRVINGPALTGANAATTPVLLTFRDTNNDTRPDMIVTAAGQSFLYLNRVDQFVLMPTEERATLYKP
jgi:hypothetical protein